jgi:hypothetical protein
MVIPIYFIVIFNLFLLVYFYQCWPIIGYLLLTNTPIKEFSELNYIYLNIILPSQTYIYNILTVKSYKEGQFQTELREI